MVYICSKDVFILFDCCVEIVNNVKVDLFILIYINVLVNNWIVKGVFIWILGLVKLDVNLEVVKWENFVILYEDDYKICYVGFNFNFVELYIIFEFM